MGCSTRRCVSKSAVSARVNLRGSDNVCEMLSVLFKVRRYEAFFGCLPAFGLLRVYEDVGTCPSLLFQGIIHARVRDVIERLLYQWGNHRCLCIISAQKILRINIIGRQYGEVPLRNPCVALFYLQFFGRFNALDVLCFERPYDTRTLRCRKQIHFATPRCEHIQGIQLASKFSTCVLFLFALLLPVLAELFKARCALCIIGKVSDDANKTIVRAGRALAGYAQGRSQK